MIYGMKCTFSHEGLRKTIRQVLKHIKDRKPQDFERLRGRIRQFKYLSKEEERRGVVGCVITLGNTGLPSLQYLHLDIDDKDINDDKSCDVLLTRRLQNEQIWYQRATITHELGHVATRKEDIQRRGTEELEWALELTADWYAYRWGFGQDIRRVLPLRDEMHHLCGPGSLFAEANLVIKISRNHVVNEASIEEAVKYVEQLEADLQSETADDKLEFGLKLLVMLKKRIEQRKKSRTNIDSNKKVQKIKSCLEEAEKILKFVKK